MPSISRVLFMGQAIGGVLFTNGRDATTICGSGIVSNSNGLENICMLLRRPYGKRPTIVDNSLHISLDAMT